MVLALFVKAKQIAPYFSLSVGIMSTDSKNKKQTNNKKLWNTHNLNTFFKFFFLKTQSQICKILSVIPQTTKSLDNKGLQEQESPTLPRNDRRLFSSSVLLSNHSATSPGERRLILQPENFSIQSTITEWGSSKRGIQRLNSRGDGVVQYWNCKLSYNDEENVILLPLWILSLWHQSNTTLGWEDEGKREG